MILNDDRTYETISEEEMCDTLVFALFLFLNFIAFLFEFEF